MNNTTATATRSQTVVALKQANPGLKVSYTLPVAQTGLAATGKNQITSLLNAGGSLDMVNIMAMDYGTNESNMGNAATTAATGTFNFLKSEFSTRGITKTDAEIWAMIGVTVMIGMNDTANEIFTLTDAQTLLSFAQEKELGMISMWSVSRDKTGTLGAVSGTGSGITQSDYAFSNVFQAYNVIPEPSSWCAGAAAAAGSLAWVRRRRRVA